VTDQLEGVGFSHLRRCLRRIGGECVADNELVSEEWRVALTSSSQADATRAKWLLTDHLLTGSAFLSGNAKVAGLPKLGKAV
jgi:hypothetical protein